MELSAVPGRTDEEVSIGMLNHPIWKATSVHRIMGIPQHLVLWHHHPRSTDPWPHTRQLPQAHPYRSCGLIQLAASRTKRAAEGRAEQTATVRQLAPHAGTTQRIGTGLPFQRLVFADALVEDLLPQLSQFALGYYFRGHLLLQPPRHPPQAAGLSAALVHFPDEQAEHVGDGHAFAPPVGHKGA